MFSLSTGPFKTFYFPYVLETIGRSVDEVPQIDNERQNERIFIQEGIPQINNSDRPPRVFTQ